MEMLLSIGVELAQAHFSAGLCFHRILACNSWISLHFLVRDFFFLIIGRYNSELYFIIYEMQLEPTGILLCDFIK